MPWKTVFGSSYDIQYTAWMERRTPARGAGGWRAAKTTQADTSILAFAATVKPCSMPVSAPQVPACRVFIRFTTLGEGRAHAEYFPDRQKPWARFLAMSYGLATMPLGLGGILRRTALRSEEHTSELQSLTKLVCRLLLE